VLRWTVGQSNRNRITKDGRVWRRSDRKYFGTEIKWIRLNEVEVQGMIVRTNRGQLSGLTSPLLGWVLVQITSSRHPPKRSVLARVLRYSHDLHLSYGRRPSLAQPAPTHTQHPARCRSSMDPQSWWYLSLGARRPNGSIYGINPPKHRGQSPSNGNVSPLVSAHCRSRPDVGSLEVGPEL
jgi:hypothetical protein